YVLYVSPQWGLCRSSGHRRLLRLRREEGGEGLRLLLLGSRLGGLFGIRLGLREKGERPRGHVPGGPGLLHTAPWFEGLHGETGWCGRLGFRRDRPAEFDRPGRLRIVGSRNRMLRGLRQSN